MSKTLHIYKTKDFSVSPVDADDPVLEGGKMFVYGVWNNTTNIREAEARTLVAAQTWADTLQSQKDDNSKSFVVETNNPTMQ